MRAWLTGVAVAFLPALAAAQAAPDSRSDIDALLATSTADSLAQSLGEQFFRRVVELVPDLTQEDRNALAEAIASGFDAPTVREDIASALLSSASSTVVVAALEARRTGAVAELARVAAAHTPPQSLQEFNAGLAGIPRARVQLAVALMEATGAGDFALNVDESVRQAAHQLVTALGGDPPPFAPLSDDEFERLYRNRTLMQTVAFLHRHGPASDDLIRRATAEHISESGRWYVESYAAAVASAVSAGGRRVAEQTVAPPEPEPAPVPTAARAVSEAEARQPCRALPCNFNIEWTGRPPEFNQTFGNAQDLPNLVFDHLLSAGYQVTRGAYTEGQLTIVLHPRMRMGLCGFMSGTDNRGCPAIDQVTIEFVGSAPGVETPKGFMLRNLCRGDMLMGVNGVASLVAARLDYAFTTFEGDKRPVPRC